MSPCTPYCDNAEHLRAEVARMEIELLQVQGGDSEGLSPEADLVGLRRQLEERLAASLEAGLSLRLPWLGAAFGLGGAELDLVVLAFAPLWEARLADIYARFGDGCAKPTRGLAARLLERGGMGRADALELLAPHAPLRRHRLLDLREPDGAALLAAELALDERIAGFLLGRDHLDPRLDPFARWAPPGRPLSELALPPPAGEALSAWLTAALERGEPTGAWLRFTGPPGTGKRAAARALCREGGSALLEIDGAALGEDPDGPRILELLVREAHLYGAAVYLDGAAAVLGPATSRLRAALFRTALEGFRRWLVVGVEGELAPDLGPRDKTIIEIPFGHSLDRLQSQVRNDFTEGRAQA